MKGNKTGGIRRKGEANVWRRKRRKGRQRDEEKYEQIKNGKERRKG